MDKRIKNDVYKIINYVNCSDFDTTREEFKKRPKILFHKRFNKLFFRAGRKILLSKFTFKKTVIQKYLSKKIYNFVKKQDLTQLQTTNIASFLIKSNIFYTINDAYMFIKTFGVLVNGVVVYNPKLNVKYFDLISIIWVRFFFKFLKKRKNNIINNIIKLKTYKFRLKHYITKKKVEWVPVQTWLLEYSSLYISKYNDIEFDVKSLSGFYMYNNVLELSCEHFYNADVSLFMSRSYTWKYII